MLLFHKRHFIMLEVLIAAVMVAFCVLPMIYPHVVMYKAESEFVRKMEVDHAVNLLYGNILEKLYLNKISWSDIQQNTFEVTDEMWQEVHLTPLPFTVTYKFTEVKHKPKTIGNYNLFEFLLTFRFVPLRLKEADEEKQEEQAQIYEYTVFIVRDLRPPGTAEQAPAQNPQTPSQTPPAPGKK